MGPGNEAFVTERCRQLVSSADTLAGFASPLELVAPFHEMDPVVLSYDNQEEAIASLYEESKQDDRVVVCCWGDPSVSDREFVDRWKQEGFEVRIVPGVSSVMVACARVQIPLEQALFLTFHRRGPLEEERQSMLETLTEGTRSVIALPHPWEFMPPDMAEWLLDREVPRDRQVDVLEELTLPEETQHSFTLGELANSEQSFSDLSIVVIRNHQS